MECPAHRQNRLSEVLVCCASQCCAQFQCTYDTVLTESSGPGFVFQLIYEYRETESKNSTIHTGVKDRAPLHQRRMGPPYLPSAWLRLEHHWKGLREWQPRIEPDAVHINWRF